MKYQRRNFLKLLGAAATGSMVPHLSRAAASAGAGLDQLYELPLAGSARLMHVTDIHAQLLPVYYREPNVNLGIGPALGQLPHLVGHTFLDRVKMADDSIEAYAYTNLNFEENARRFGKMGGFAHLKTLIDQLRESAGGQQNTLMLDGGDLWQGSATALWTRGKDMVEASNLLGVDLMTGHWEFTYAQREVLENLELFNGEFIGQNVRVKEDSLFDDAYFELVEEFGGLGLYDEDEGYAFKPYVMREVNGANIAIVGQAFPRTSNANPPGFFPDWSFNLRSADMQDLVENIRERESPAAVILLSHNGMDVDLKMASEVSGIDAILGGHTHDGIPVPIPVDSPNGKVCMVTNAGTNGKFVGVLDLDIRDGALTGLQYQMLPVFADLLPADADMQTLIDDLRARQYDQVIESRVTALQQNPERTGMTFQAILDQRLAKAGETLYRRGNFMGTWDQLICDALRYEYQADIALSPGFRWGTSVLSGEWITMEDVMTQTAITYGETYLQKMTGAQIRDILEGVADNLFDPDPYLQSGGDMVRVGGMDYAIDPNLEYGSRIYEMVLDSGDAIDLEKEYKVSGWAVVGDAPSGRLVWDIVRDYLLAERDDNETIQIAKMNHPLLLNVSDNPGLEDYPGELR